MKRIGPLLIACLFFASAYANEVDDFWNKYEDGGDSDQIAQAPKGNPEGARVTEENKKTTTTEHMDKSSDLSLDFEVDYRTFSEFELSIMLGDGNQYFNAHASYSDFGFSIGYRLTKPFKKFLSRFSIGGELGTNFDYGVFDQKLSLDSLYYSGSLMGKLYTRFRLIEDLYLVSGVELFLSSRAKRAESYDLGDQKTAFFDSAWFFGVEL